MNIILIMNMVSWYYENRNSRARDTQGVGKGLAFLLMKVLIGLTEKTHKTVRNRGLGGTTEFGREWLVENRI